VTSVALRILILGLLAAGSTAIQSGQAPLQLPGAETVAPGVSYVRFDARDHLGAGGHISARLLEVRPSSVRLDVELGKDGAQGRDTVTAMAARRGAIAAVNAGFFGTNGDPAGIYKINGTVTSDTTRPRGAVGFAKPEGAPLLFDRVTVTATLRIRGARIPVTGIDTARGAKGVVVYTPRFGADTRTAAGGTEWTLSGRPLRVTAINKDGRSAIPRDGFVISAADAPPALARLRSGDRVDIDFAYGTSMGTSVNDWRRADDIVGGAGMLLWRGREVRDWSVERLDVKGFVEARHPRTVIGRDREGDVWLVVVDGRQPDHSVGMSLPELIAFCRRLGFVDALNLDGGGSTTMVVKGAIVNKPSDAIGPRPVSDAIVVLNR
jgi:hypothetical protein